MGDIAKYTTEQQMALCFTLAMIVAIVTVLGLLISSLKK